MASKARAKAKSASNRTSRRWLTTGGMAVGVVCVNVANESATFLWCVCVCVLYFGRYAESLLVKATWGQPYAITT